MIDSAKNISRKSVAEHTIVLDWTLRFLFGINKVSFPIDPSKFMDGILGVKNWRTKRGISLESIAAATKLSVRQLEAIECGDFKRLPGGIYNTSYIKQYARAIDFDEDDLLAFYRKSSNPSNANSSGTRAPSTLSGALFQN
jgi:hypothetical protein